LDKFILSAFMTKRPYVLFTILTLFSYFSVFSQITVTPTSGCAPLGVTFNSPVGGTNILWNFDDGAFSNQQNPTHTFATKGTYVVTYTAIGFSAQTLTVNVYGKPTPSFSVTSPTEGCVPYAVSFQDHSTAGGSAFITTWQWAFGDGGTATGSPTQTYTYGAGGEFNVSIKVTDSNGCDSSITVNDVVIVSQKPTISLVTSPNPASACVPPLTVTFTAGGSTSHSPLGSTLTYTWNFGGGVTSTLATPPAQTYTALGIYTVNIQVTDSNHCTNSATIDVTIQHPTATFTVPDTVCINTTTTFNPTGSTAGTQLWTYGDGTTGSINTHTYTASGHYYVVLKVTNGACSDTVGHSIYVQNPAANFSVSPTYMCSLPKTVSITNLSVPAGGTHYQWNYYQYYTQYSLSPLTSTSVSPTFTLTHLDTNRYTINTLNMVDSIDLVMITSPGCIAHKTLIYIDTIFLSTARFVTSLYQGCVPLTVNFADSSRVGPHEHITSWNYIFGDGATTTITSAPGNTVHTYTSTGIYYPKLVIQTQDGCGDTSFTIKIEVGKPPVASFSVAPTSICIGDTVHFTNTTPAADSVDTWHYYADGNYYASSCSNDANPSWSFTHATGAQNVSLVACFRGCCDTATQTGAVTVKGPLATFSAAMDCDSASVFTFTADTSGALNWTWNFGDGTVIANSTSVTIAHTYSATGDYNVILTSFNSGTGCAPYIDTVKIHVRNIVAKFTYDTLLCSTVPYAFNAGSSNNVYTYGNNGYIWLWGDGTHPDITSDSLINHAFTTHGTYTVTLITKDINECPDTIKKVIKAYSIAAGFVPAKNTMCANSTMTFSNTSTADTTIISYNWNFGDGSPPPPNTATPSHTYSITNTSINTVTVTLNIVSALGCVSTATNVITISRPNAAFHVLGSLNICSGDSINFASVNSFPNMTWAYGDGTTLGPTPPSTNNWHHYTTSGVYTTTLTIADSIGCIDITTSGSQTVNVQNIPTVVITSPAFGSSTLCYPYLATFTDASTVNVFMSRNWDLHDGAVTNNALSTITDLYATPGTYTVSLTETTTNGCTATNTYTFTVNGPIANFTVSKDSICKGQSITFTITDTTDVYTWGWDFGDGTGDTAVSPVTHTYNFHPPGGTTNALLIYWSADSSCKGPPIPFPINIYQVIANFKRNNELTKQDTAHCLGTTDVFTNTSTTTGGTTTNFWNFGNGVTSTTVSPSYQYTVAGTYSVELIIKNTEAGCTDTMIKQMIIYPLFNNEAVNGDTICKAANAQLTATGNGVSYTWTPSSGLNSANISNPTASPSVTTTYTVYATDINGCKDSVTSFVFVQQPPVPISWDTTIVVGQFITLPGGQGPGFSYTWTPTTNLSCTSCSTPVYNGTVNATFVETIADNRGCFTVQSTFTIDILPEASIAVPTAFTPNGDGTNDIIYVAGWGIKSLVYFKIFNRWGELIFQSEDIKVGWDGTYRGVPQNIETYVYEASAMSYISDKPLTKKGYINLLR
jgi:gliding motility-associated-like protein